MAKTNSPLWCMRAWGQVGESVVSQWCGSLGSGIFRREGSYTQLERYYEPFNRQTEAQQDNRSMFLNAVAAWQGLGASDWASWNYYQDVRRRRPIMSGYNLFISKYLLSAGDPRIPPSGRKEDWEQESGWSMPEEGGGAEMVIKSGQATGGSVAFGTAFGSVPNVIATAFVNEAGDIIYDVRILTKTASGFTYLVLRHTGANTWADVTASVPIEWIATDAGNA